MRLLITGGNGFLSYHLKNSLKKYKQFECFFTSKQEFDLTDLNQAISCINKYNPEFIIHNAALQGGIEANVSRPAEYFYQNITLTANIFEASKTSKVIKKIIVPMGGCSYPGNAISPIDESQMWNGFPQKESAPFSLAKKMSIIASKAYFSQYNIKSSIIIPGNMYGEYDNFRYKESHVIPSLIRKIYESKNSHIEVFGTGKPIRDFIYAGDVADAICKFLLDVDFPGPINISNESKITIKELVDLLIKLFNFKGEVKWLKNKPDGQMIKIFSTKLMKEKNIFAHTSLEDGLIKTINWFKNNYESNNIRL